MKNLNKTKKKVVKKFFALVTFLGVSAVILEKANGAITNHYVNKIIADNKEDDLLVLPSTYEIDTKKEEICSGEKFISELIKEDIDYLQYGEQLFTRDGRDVAKLVVHVNHVSKVPASLIKNENGAYVYVAPEGYTLSGAFGIKKEEDYIVLYKEIDPNGEYQVLSTSNTKVLEITEVTIVDSLPFSVLEEMNLNKIVIGEEKDFVFTFTPNK